MARDLDLHADELKRLSRRLFQSGNINFLLGSGASAPVIPVVGTIESQIAQLYKEKKVSEANLKLCEFLWSVQSPTNDLINNVPNTLLDNAIKNYSDFLRNLELVLTERHTDLLPKQANVFTTNYDLFIEKAAESRAALKLNDGFARIARLAPTARYSAQTFYDSVYARGPLHRHKVEVPCVNLVKLHGSLSWLAEDKDILFEVSAKPSLSDDDKKDEIKLVTFVDSFAVVLPELEKFQTTVLNDIHYDLFRIFANELEKPHTLLVTFGFSFDDNHILRVAERAFSNPTLVIFVFAHTEAAVEGYKKKFDRFTNVYIIRPAPGEKIEFREFNQALRALLPREENT